MSIKFVQKQKPLPEVKAHLDHLAPNQTAEMAEKVDQMAHLKALIEAADVSAETKLFEAEKKIVASFAAKFGADIPEQEVILLGDKATITFSPVGDSKQCTNMHGLIGALKAKIGYEALLSILKVNVTDVAKYLSESEMEQFYTKVPGSRRLLSITLKEEA